MMVYKSKVRLGYRKQHARSQLLMERSNLGIAHSLDTFSNDILNFHARSRR